MGELKSSVKSCEISKWEVHSASGSLPALNHNDVCEAGEPRQAMLQDGCAVIGDAEDGT